MAYRRLAVLVVLALVTAQAVAQQDDDDRKTNDSARQAPRVWVPGQKGRPAPRLERALRRDDPLETTPLRRPERPVIERPARLGDDPDRRTPLTGIPDPRYQRRIVELFGYDPGSRVYRETRIDRTMRPFEPLDFFDPDARSRSPLLTREAPPTDPLRLARPDDGPLPLTGRNLLNYEQELKERENRLQRLRLGLHPSQSIVGAYRRSDPLLDTLSPTTGRYRRNAPYLDAYYNARSYGFGGALEGYRPWSSPVDQLLQRRQAPAVHYRGTESRDPRQGYDLLRGLVPGTDAYGSSRYRSTP